MKSKEDSLCSGKLKNLSKFCILILTISIICLGWCEDRKRDNGQAKPQNEFIEASMVKSNNYSNIEINPLQSNLVASGGIIEPINSPIFIESITYAGLEGGNYDDIITPTMRIVIKCESGGHHIDPKTGKITTGQAGELGIAQFMQSTFDWFSNLSGIKGTIYSERDQIILMRWAFDNGYASHWTCYRDNFM